MGDKKQNSSNEWDLNNIHISNSMNVFEEVLFECEDGESFNQSLTSQKQAKDFSPEFQSDEISPFLHLTKPPKRYRVKSASDLKRNGFVRIGNSQKLIHKSTKDLWELKKDTKGEYYIEELFDGPDPLADTV